MARTIYEKKNQEFTNRAHLAAQRLIYHDGLFNEADSLTFESTSLSQGEEGRRRDGDMGIDRLVWVTLQGSGNGFCKFKQPLKFPVQERFRKINYHRWRDITITEWNHASDLPSELYKIEADFFVYGYFSEPSCMRCGEPLEKGNICKRWFEGGECGGECIDEAPCFWEWVVVDVPKFKWMLIQKSLPYRLEENKKRQTFLGFKFEVLAKSGLIVACGGTHCNMTLTQAPRWKESTITNYSLFSS